MQHWEHEIRALKTLTWCERQRVAVPSPDAVASDIDWDRHVPGIT
jgi:hypothetical protein